MTLQAAPAFIGTTGYEHPVELLRNLTSALAGRRSGLFAVGDFLVSPTANTQEVSIAKGFVYLQGQESDAQGGYFCWSDAADTYIFPAPSAQPRIDTLVLRVIDKTYGADEADEGAYIEIIQGTPNASPVAVADSTFDTSAVNWRPGAWFRIADVRINPGDTVVPGGQIANNLKYVKTPALIPKKTAQYGSPNPQSSTVSNVFVNTPNISAMSFTKLYDDTALDINFSASCFASASASEVEFALRINGVDYFTAGLWFNLDNVHLATVDRGATILGLPAGTYIAQPRWRRATPTTGGVGIMTNNTDRYRIVIEERNV